MQRPQPEKDVEISRDEFKKIERAMKKPEFMGLMNDYMLEISDPKNRAQYDQYIQQLQKDKELPKGMRLIRPQPQFCVKTTLISTVNKRHQMKIFLNFCSCIDLEKPTFAQSERGQNWQLPHSVNKIRYDQDSKGDVCNTADVAFHPQTMQLCMMQAFQKMVIQAGIEGVGKQLGERKESLSLDYVVMKNLKCKGGEPALMPIRFSESGQLLKKGQNEDERGREGRETKLQRDINKQKEQLKKQKEKPDQTPVFDEIQNEAPVEEGVQRPRHKVIYSYPVEYQDFIDERVKQQKYPNYLNIDFEVPRVESVKELCFEMNEELIRLQAEDKYFIELRWEQLKLKYKLLEGRAKSKFDKKKKKLRLIIPVDLQSLPKQVYTPPTHEIEHQHHQQQQHHQQHQHQQPTDKDEQKAETVEPLKPTQNTTEKEDVRKEEEEFDEEKLWQSKNKLLEINQPIRYQAIVSQEEQTTEKHKPLIEEVDEDDHQHSQPQPKPQPSLTQEKPRPKIFKTVNYHFQQTSQKAMIVINLPKYRAELVDCMLDQQQILFEYSQEEPLYLNLSVAHPFLLKDSRHTMIKDFIVINLIKKEPTIFWEKSSITKQDISYPEFVEKKEVAKLKHQEIELEKKRRAQEEIQERRQAELRLRQQEEAREKERQVKLEAMRKKLQAEGSGKDYGAHFIQFSNVELLWQLD